MFEKTAGPNEMTSTTRDTVSDFALVARARCGDACAFAELVARHQAFLVHTARSILRSPEDAEIENPFGPKVLPMSPE